MRRMRGVHTGLMGWGVRGDEKGDGDIWQLEMPSKVQILKCEGNINILQDMKHRKSHLANF